MLGAWLRVLALLVSLAVAGWSAPELVVDRPGKVFEKFEVGLYEDTAGAETITTIRRLPFRPHLNRFSEGFTDRTYWIRLRIVNRTGRDLHYYLHLSEPQIDDIEFYRPNRSGAYEVVWGGFGQRREWAGFHTPTFEIVLPKGETTDCYLRLRATRFPLYTELLVMDEPSLLRRTFDEARPLYLFAGAVLALVLLNLFLYFLVREGSHLYFALASIFLVGWLMLATGYGPTSAFESVGSFAFYNVSLPLWLLFFILFGREQLASWEDFPGLDRFLKWLGVSVAAAGVALPFFTRESLWALMALSIVAGVGLVALGVRARAAGRAGAPCFTAAVMTAGAAFTPFAAMALGWLGYEPWVRLVAVAGGFVMVLCLSLAMASRIRSIESEKAKLIEQAKKELTRKVRERTRNLEISKEKLSKLAEHDALTELYNRRAFSERAEYAIHMARRHGKPLSLMLMDIDYFKQINDRYGHIVGDRIIRALADILKETRESDIAGRLGGDEFVLLMPDTDRAGAKTIAEKIAQRAREVRIETEKGPVGLTLSCGLYTVLPDRETKLRDLIHFADLALYRAKEKGRNRVESEPAA
ncbi:diguanylate cyclase [Hydrogenimonas sp.]